MMPTGSRRPATSASTWARRRASGRPTPCSTRVTGEASGVLMSSLGSWSAHRRPHTEELIAGSRGIPRRIVEYRGTLFEEMDLEALLRRHPKVALVDELAHTNVPGSSHNPKRWQDVMELLSAGIDVITTVNIQHLESIADAVEQITGVPIKERVPDWVLRKADQIELVDSSPEQLRRRMLHGNIYPPEKVPQALTHFFREDNLMALRELALRFLADETEEELLEHLKAHQTGVLWETSERILVGVTAAPGTDAIVRRASRMASRIKAELHVLHIISGEGSKRGDDETSWRSTAVDHRCRRPLERSPSRRSRASTLRVRSHPSDHPDRRGLKCRSRWQELKSGGSIVRKISHAGCARRHRRAHHREAWSRRGHRFDQ
jgi:hypothetical protein